MPEPEGQSAEESEGERSGSGEVPTDPARSRGRGAEADPPPQQSSPGQKVLPSSAGQAAPAFSPRRQLRDRNVELPPEGAPLAGGAGLLQLLPGPGQRAPRLQPQPEPPLPAAGAAGVRELRRGVRAEAPHAAGLPGAGGARPPLPAQPGDLQPERRPDAALHPPLLPQRVRGQRSRHRQQDRAGHGSGQESPDVRRAGGGGSAQGADQRAGGEELPPGEGKQLAEEPG